MINTCYVPCPDCKRQEDWHLVACWVDSSTLTELNVEAAEDVELDEIYERHHRDDGVEIDGVCSECGSDYVRDADGRIID